jgi:hypothetical protein
MLERHAENRLPPGVLSSRACGLSDSLPNAVAALRGVFLSRKQPPASLSTQNNSAGHGLCRASVQAFLRNTKRGCPRPRSSPPRPSPAEELLSGNIEDSFRYRMSLSEAVLAASVDDLKLRRTM